MPCHVLRDGARSNCCTRFRGLYFGDLSGWKRGLVVPTDGRLRNGGLGSSHTTPRGAAVPARPPTRSIEPKDAFVNAQWAARATEQGTEVVVLARYTLVLLLSNVNYCKQRCYAKSYIW
jgi:hypothetical protein